MRNNKEDEKINHKYISTVCEERSNRRDCVNRISKKKKRRVISGAIIIERRRARREERKEKENEKGEEEEAQQEDEHFRRGERKIRVKRIAIEKRIIGE